ncbi:nascent polypeptide-associated complex subunit alpha, muscle-specific form [Leguminivora glycinivorella]|uniref:nascent polypeptide-associated complex subunit alpha, muscle-specific form n=1 Tax=Leguminivora glycinivorella TaxID=1035111 RepID=UPI00200BCF93|nr:nascent polypeptide-associated complex subunit alpha, muscle-specific form [Leguminivora glycinivorella]
MWGLSALALWALLAAGRRGVAVCARELDPAACAARFDVQRDKIIRTEESREMGARYLAELDVGARQECLRLCCETDACDVFVYEEKSPGSCYLFACGPPEDFRCKFTAHGNFSSGVLAVARRRAEQQDRARLEQHERALANLRYAPPGDWPARQQRVLAVARRATRARAGQPQVRPARRPARTPAARAGRGAPSNTSTRWPTSGTPRPATGPHASSACWPWRAEQHEHALANLRYAPPGDRPALQQRVLAVARRATRARAGQPQVRPARRPARTPAARAGRGAPSNTSTRWPTSGTPRPATGPHASSACWPWRAEQHEHALANLRYLLFIAARRCSRYQFECHTGGECIAVYNACDGVPQCADGSDEAPELGCPAPPTRAPTPPPPPPPPPTQIQDISVEVGGEGAGGERWPHRLAQAQPHRYGANEVGGSHIFSHKGGLLQPPREEPPFYEPPPPPAWPRAPWPQPQNVMDSGWGSYARPEWPEPDPRRAWPVPQPRPEPDIPVYIPSKTMPELPLAYGGQQQHTLRDAPKKGPPPHAPSALAPSSTTPSVTPPPPPRPQHDNVSNKSVKQEVAAPAAGPGGDIEVPRYTAAHAPHFLSDERDGLSDHPPAAVLLLVLGVLMTAAMAVLGGCRARAARRRLRRGKSPFAHDADYLVNGMYL